jgi:hypothetical protein
VVAMTLLPDDIHHAILVLAISDAIITFKKINAVNNLRRRSGCLSAGQFQAMDGKLASVSCRCWADIRSRLFIKKHTLRWTC